MQPQPHNSIEDANNTKNKTMGKYIKVERTPEEKEAIKKKQLEAMAAGRAKKKELLEMPKSMPEVIKDSPAAATDNTEATEALLKQVKELAAENLKLKQERSDLEQSLYNESIDTSPLFTALQVNNMQEAIEKVGAFNNAFNAIFTALGVKTPTEALQAIGHIKELATKQPPKFEHDEEGRLTLFLPPITFALMKATTEKLSAKFGFEVTPQLILVDMFLRYTVERNTAWFYDFVLSKTEMIQIAKAINPEIESLEGILKLSKKS